jgi:chorismate--pyruvate lyase
MKLEQKSPWDTFEAIEPLINSDEIKSWLLEKGPITKRIKTMGTFKLKLIQDKISEVEKSEILFLNSKKGKFRVREVKLFCNGEPKIFARTIIPVITIEEGFSDLGKIGNKPLGDILFEKKIFTKEEIVFASFKYEEYLFWGRNTKYTVKGYPFSVMELFLINDY